MPEFYPPTACFNAPASAHSPDGIERGEPGDDNFDRWNLNRDQSFLQANPYNYGPAWMPGLYDLAGDGNWQNDPIYGNAWEPTDVSADWTPYSTGRWVFEPYYGWTWVDNDPWGYAPFHYGRWFHDRHHRWAWDPDGGVLAAQQPWSPALVAFVGFGGNRRISRSPSSLRVRSRHNPAAQPAARPAPQAAPQRGRDRQRNG